MSDEIERLQRLVEGGRLDQVASEIARMRASREFIGGRFEAFIAHRLPGIFLNRYLCRQPGVTVENLRQAFPDWDANVRAAARDGTLPALAAAILDKLGARSVNLVIPPELVDDRAAAAAAAELRHTYTCPTTTFDGRTCFTLRRRDGGAVSREDVKTALRDLARAAAPELPGARLRELELAFADGRAREESQ